MPRRRRRRTYRRRPTSRSAPRRRRTYRRRRRNAGVTAFTHQGARSNPLILSNPPRRRRRRSNPRPNLKRIVSQALVHLGGGAVGYGVNQFGLAAIENDWARRAAQVAAGIAAATLMKGELGAAAAGAIYYPLVADLAMFSGLVAIPTEADLDELSADLESSLLEDDELYIEDLDSELYVP